MIYVKAACWLWIGPQGRLRATPPEITSFSPADGTVINTGTPGINISYMDSMTGVDTESIILEIDGTPVSPGMVSSSSLTYVSGTALPSGSHTVSISLCDNAGNISSLTNTITVQAGVPDEWRLKYFGTTNLYMEGDIDGDGLMNKDEYEAGTDPLVADSDGDGMLDGWEKRYSLDPLLKDGNGDMDGDGLTDAEECKLGLDPMNAADALELLEKERARIITRWHMVMDTELKFENEPGSAEDLEDIRQAINTLSERFFKEESK